jgi:transcriptional regulator with XRE-family HTH domain
MSLLDKSEIAQRLKAYRKQHNLSARKFSMLAGIDQSQYNKVENLVLTITETMVEKFQKAFPDFNREYILFGTALKIANSISGKAESGGTIQWIDHIASLKISEKDKIELYRQQLILAHNEIQFWKQIVEAQVHLNKAKTANSTA